MNKDDKIIELLEKILEKVSSIDSNTNMNDSYLGDLSKLDDIDRKLENISKKLESISKK